MHLLMSTSEHDARLGAGLAICGLGFFILALGMFYYNHRKNR